MEDQPPLVCVVLPAVLTALFPGCPREVELRAATIGEALAALEARVPGISGRICDSTPAIRRHMRIFAGGIRADLETRLVPGTEVLVMTAISGG
jgi:sulfur-carrier protein